MCDDSLTNLQKGTIEETVLLNCRPMVTKSGEWRPWKAYLQYKTCIVNFLFQSKQVCMFSNTRCLDAHGWSRCIGICATQSWYWGGKKSRSMSCISSNRFVVFGNQFVGILLGNECSKLASIATTNKRPKDGRPLHPVQQELIFEL